MFWHMHITLDLHVVVNLMILQCFYEIEIYSIFRKFCALREHSVQTRQLGKFCDVNMRKIFHTHFILIKFK